VIAVAVDTHSMLTAFVLYTALVATFLCMLSGVSSSVELMYTAAVVAQTGHSDAQNTNEHCNAVCTQRTIETPHTSAATIITFVHVQLCYLLCCIYACFYSCACSQFTSVGIERKQVTAAQHNDEH
jgi:hypothetical protein